VTLPALTTTPLAHVVPLSIPSPATGVWYVGDLPIRGYALSIILGIIVAIWIGEKRWAARGGRVGDVQDLAIWAIPFGLVGARLYHVATDSGLYFGEGQDPVEALYIWNGGLGIWGAVALGAVGIYVGARRKGIRLLPMLDALAPGVIVAQAIGRWGNWFNQELYGRPTDLPWGLEIDPQNYPEGLDFAAGTTFHPTYLYEFLWNLGVFGLLIWADRRFKLGFGRVMALYVMGYTVGRGWIEHLRIDTVELDDVAGLRLNVWTSIVLFLAAAAYFVWSSRRHPGREDSAYLPGREPDDEADETDEPVTADETDDAPSGTAEPVVVDTGVPGNPGGTASPGGPAADGPRDRDA
jgi:prolipoprotein diacylglyceryl transferase